METGILLAVRVTPEEQEQMALRVQQAQQAQRDQQAQQAQKDHREKMALLAHKEALALKAQQEAQGLRAAQDRLARLDKWVSPAKMGSRVKMALLVLRGHPDPLGLRDPQDQPEPRD